MIGFFGLAVGPSGSGFSVAPLASVDVLPRNASALPSPAAYLDGAQGSPPPCGDPAWPWALCTRALAGDGV